LASRYRAAVEELEPVRALAASLREAHANDATAGASLETVQALQGLPPHTAGDPEL
jgi:hypothetical protein